jgi:hypothetical protein
MDEIVRSLFLGGGEAGRTASDLQCAGAGLIVLRRTGG